MNRNKIKTYGTIILSIIGVVIITFVLLPGKDKKEQAFLENHGMASLSIEEMVKHLENERNEKNGLIASINGTTLRLGDLSNKYEYKIPKFYLSIAPYINNTHPCSIHNLITCNGELKNQSFSVIVRDNDGNIVYDDTLQTLNNGFMGIWLPRDIKGTITVSANGKSATTDITTYKDSNTCLTSLQLM